jgi:hypothetical protein
MRQRIGHNEVEEENEKIRRTYISIRISYIIKSKIKYSEKNPPNLFVLLLRLILPDSLPHSPPLLIQVSSRLYCISLSYYLILSNQCYLLALL